MSTKKIAEKRMGSFMYDLHYSEEEHKYIISKCNVGVENEVTVLETLLFDDEGCAKNYLDNL